MKKILILFILLATCFTGFSQGGFPVVNPSTLIDAFVFVQHSTGTDGVALDNLIGGSSGAKVYSTADDFVSFLPSGVPVENDFVFDTRRGSWNRKNSGAGYTTLNLNNGELAKQDASFIDTSSPYDGDASLSNLFRFQATGTQTTATVNALTNLNTQQLGERFVIDLNNQSSNSCTYTFNAQFKRFDGSNFGTVVMQPSDQKLISFEVAALGGTYQLIAQDAGAASFVGVTGSGTINTIPKWSGSSSLTDSNVTDDGTSVTITSSIDDKPAAIFQNDYIGSLRSAVKIKNGGGFDQDVELVLQNDNSGDSCQINLDATDSSLDVLINNGAKGGFILNNDRLDLATKALQLSPTTASNLSALIPAHGDVVANNTFNNGDFKIDDAIYFREAGNWMDRNEDRIATEVGTTTTTVLWGQILPVDATANNVTVGVPIGIAQTGDYFIISYSRVAATNTITIDFSSSGYNYYGGTSNPTITSASTVKFVYVNATVGFIAM